VRAKRPAVKGRGERARTVAALGSVYSMKAKPSLAESIEMSPYCRQGAGR